MTRRDSGAVEFGAVLLLFFIAALVAGGALFAASGMAYARSDARYFQRHLAADRLLNDIVAAMQPLRMYPYDDRRNELLESLERRYAEYALAFADVSSGYHLDFLSDEDMADRNIARFLFRDNSGAAFARWRDANGLSASAEPWRELVKEEAWECCVPYGWIHLNGTDSFAFRTVSKTFGTANPDKLFPLVNNFPRMNVNMVEPDILRPLITRTSFKVEKPAEKTDALVNALRRGPLASGDVAAILRIPQGHPLMGYLGTKTAFWKASFAISPALKVEAVIAAIPRKNGDAQEVEEYRLIDRSFVND